MAAQKADKIRSPLVLPVHSAPDFSGCRGISAKFVISVSAT